MAYTVSSSFEKFYSNINLSGDHRDIANRRRDDIVSTLEKKFTILEAFSTGSIPRYTAVKGYADLDIIVALHYGNHIKDRKPSEVLQEVRDALGVYRNNVRKNGQAVTLYYKTWPNVDIVPASRVLDYSGNITSYNIPDMNTETWLSSKPKSHSKNIIDSSSSCGPRFRQIITMIKWWNKKHSSILQSYHIEVMALKIFTGQLSDYSWEVYLYFKEANQLIQSNLWHDGSQVDSYLDWNKRYEAHKRLETAQDRALEAWYKTFGDNNDHRGAIKIWRQIFGDKFPVYG